MFANLFPKISPKMYNLSVIYSSHNMEWVNIKCCIEGQLYVSCLYTIKEAISNTLNFF